MITQIMWKILLLEIVPVRWSKPLIGLDSLNSFACFCLDDDDIDAHDDEAGVEHGTGRSLAKIFSQNSLRDKKTSKMLT